MRKRSQDANQKAAKQVAKVMTPPLPKDEDLLVGEKLRRVPGEVQSLQCIN